MTRRPIVYHIPVCPFSQRLEILLALKGLEDAVEFEVVDITRPRDPELLAKTGGSTSLPVMELADGTVIKESLVILAYLDETFGTPVARPGPVGRAIERMLIAREGGFTAAGYRLVMNQDIAAREALVEKLIAEYRALGDFLLTHNRDGVFLFERFGLAEAVFAPILRRFDFLDYYEDFRLPEGPVFERVARWKAGCLDHPAAGQVGTEEVVKLYYDYARGAGNGALLAGRERSSFVFEPHWAVRPWPPKDKYGEGASDAALGLVNAG